MFSASRHLPLAAAFVLGACTAAAVQSSASTPATPEATTASPITSSANAERRRAPNDKATVTILARGENAFVARLDMDANAAVPEHRDATEEYIVVLEGSGTITVDDEAYPLAAGDTVFMPANAKVSFTNGDAPFRGLQVFAGPAPAAKYDAWTLVE